MNRGPFYNKLSVTVTSPNPSRFAFQTTRLNRNSTAVPGIRTVRSPRAVCIYFRGAIFIMQQRRPYSIPSATDVVPF